MLESLIPLFQGLLTAVKAMTSFDAFSKKKSGDIRALIDELKENSRLCFRVIEDNIPHQNVIPHFSTRVFDQLNQAGFDFNALKQQKIPPFAGIEKSNLASWPGKRTAELVENIYDKIKELRSRHAFTPDAAQHRRRIINIHKRILLLLQHAKGPQGESDNE